MLLLRASVEGSGQLALCIALRSLRMGRGALATYDDTVFPGKNGKFIETSDQIPTGSDVASDEDAER